MQKYRVVWEDDFKKNGPPDPKNWNFEHGFARNEELQWYQPDNARCEKSLLIIEGRRERVKNPNFKPGSGNWRENREFAEYTATSMTTQGLHEFLYGRFELRAKIDTRAGLWPAFWTIGTVGEWPSCGEIDIMEYYRGKLLANVAWGTRERWKARWASTATELAKLGGPDWSQRFHTWRMDWDEKAIELSVDGRVLNRTELAKTINEGDQKNPFTQPHYILLNLAIGGQNGGDPTPTTFPARFEVDWVRVSQKR